MSANVEVVVRAEQRLQSLPLRLNEQEGFSEVVDALKAGRSATLDGVWGSSCALVAANLVEHATGPLVVVCPRQSEVDDFCEELRLFLAGTAARFPAWESETGERMIHDEIYADRLRTLKPLINGDPPPVVVTSVESLLQAAPSRETVQRSTVRLEQGKTLDVQQLLKWLAESRFHHTSAVELPGEYSARGGILDVFAPDWLKPIRVELFDDEIESLRSFEVSTQRSLENLAAIDITILQPGADDGESFGSFLPPDAWVLLLEPEQMDETARNYLGRLEHPDRFHSWAAARQSLAPFATLSAASVAQGALEDAAHLKIESVERFSGEVAKVRDELRNVAGGDDVYIVSSTQAEADRLEEILADKAGEAAVEPKYIVGVLRAGFRLRREGVLLISGDELFHRGHVSRPQRRQLGKALDSFLDLREGDLVVHLAHGIGRYRGLKLIEKDEQIEEHLSIEFHGGAKVYVPATKIGLVQKYVGGAKRRPTLGKIGGKTWLRQKQAAEAAVADLAVDMLEIQASRTARPGIAFAADTEWQREFDAAFPYQETPDQLVAIDAIKVDMQTSRPMDRLLCGDVGFGKTEMAMRAAFKAVESGYQVAILAPTTILVEQHYRSFCERMSEFPVDIGKLSRFCTTAEQRQTIQGLAAGRVDIVVGTHRLASKDVNFFNLGLVIIDEEQRFGVEVKERLKTLRSSVDVLTLSATPIPRTLHMSLVGVRDISNLETAPEDRIAVETRVTRYAHELIRHALLRELNRGGQAYFVHNRINDIEALKQKLEFIVPEASIRIGHGQMHENELEQVMIDFVEGRFDILLATTIVESGLDIPNANTIFIDEAHRYGLADLHQLRGRVGRYKHRAYCYLLVDPAKSLTPNAAKRLRTIEEFSEMGAGFSIAMRDLEIRGAGNLLGTQQSGHIATVGYELYCQLLESAVAKLKQLPTKLSIDVDVDLPGEAHLPSDYVGDMRMKIDFYRRLTRATTFDDLRELREELLDRFGTPPPPVERLLDLATLRMEAAVWQMTAIYVEGRFLVFKGSAKSRIEQLAKQSRRKLRVVDDESLYLELPPDSRGDREILKLVKSVLRQEA